MSFIEKAIENIHDINQLNILDIETAGLHAVSGTPHQFSVLNTNSKNVYNVYSKSVPGVTIVSPWSQKKYGNILPIIERRGEDLGTSLEKLLRNLQNNNNPILIQNKRFEAEHIYHALHISGRLDLLQEFDDIFGFQFKGKQITANGKRIIEQREITEAYLKDIQQIARKGGYTPEQTRLKYQFTSTSLDTNRALFPIISEVDRAQYTFSGHRPLTSGAHQATTDTIQTFNLLKKQVKAGIITADEAFEIINKLNREPSRKKFIMNQLNRIMDYGSYKKVLHEFNPVLEKMIAMEKPRYLHQMQALKHTQLYTKSLEWKAGLKLYYKAMTAPTRFDTERVMKSVYNIQKVYEPLKKVQTYEEFMSFYKTQLFEAGIDIDVGTQWKQSMLPYLGRGGDLGNVIDASKIGGLKGKQLSVLHLQAEQSSEDILENLYRTVLKYKGADEETIYRIATEGKLSQRIKGTIQSNKGAFKVLGIGAAVIGGAYILRKLMSSNKEDKNMIKGLSDRGYSQQLNELLTDFGSPYQGPKASSIVSRFIAKQKSLKQINPMAYYMRTNIPMSAGLMIGLPVLLAKDKKRTAQVQAGVFVGYTAFDMLARANMPAFVKSQGGIPFLLAKMAVMGLSYYAMNKLLDKGNVTQGSNKSSLQKLQERRTRPIRRQLTFGDIYTRSIKDRVITTEEIQEMVDFAVNGKRPLQVSTRQDILDVVEKEIKWKRPKSLKSLKVQTMTRQNLGEMGFYNSNTDLLRVGTRIKRRQFLNTLSYITSQHGTKGIDYLLENFINTTRSTALHEGLHGVWDLELSREKKAAMGSWVNSEMQKINKLGEDYFSKPSPISNLMNKSPAYANIINTSIQLERMGDKWASVQKSYNDWIANEIFAHTGESWRYNQRYDWSSTPDVFTDVLEEYVDKRNISRAEYDLKMDISSAMRERIANLPKLEEMQSNRLQSRKDVNNALTQQASNFSLFGNDEADNIVNGIKIRDKIMKFRREVWDNYEKRRDIQRRLREETAKSIAEMGTLKPSELEDIDYVGGIQGLNIEREGIKRLDLSDFNVYAEDADTLILRRSGLLNFFFGKDIAIRMAGIDAPEIPGHKNDPVSKVGLRLWSEQPGGEEATKILRDLIAEQKNLQLYLDPNQKSYGRYIGVLAGESKQGTLTNINLEAVRRGAGRFLPFGARSKALIDWSEFRKAERFSQEQDRGMWKYAAWDVFQEAQQEIRRSITNTSFDRLDRVASNLNLASLFELMYRQGTSTRLNYSDLTTARHIGAKIQFWRGTSHPKDLSIQFGSKGIETIKKRQGPASSIMSSRDDDHLKIEAFGHQGMAAQSRKQFTDFGSGFQPSKMLMKAIIKGTESVRSTEMYNAFKTFMVPTVKSTVGKEADILLTGAARLPGSTGVTSFAQNIAKIEGSDVYTNVGTWFAGSGSIRKYLGKQDLPELDVIMREQYEDIFQPLRELEEHIGGKIKVVGTYKGGTARRMALQAKTKRGIRLRGNQTDFDIMLMIQGRKEAEVAEQAMDFMNKSGWVSDLEVVQDFSQFVKETDATMSQLLVEKKGKYIGTPEAFRDLLTGKYKINPQELQTYGIGRILSRAQRLGGKAEFREFEDILNRNIQEYASASYKKRQGMLKNIFEAYGIEFGNVERKVEKALEDMQLGNFEIIKSEPNRIQANITGSIIDGQSGSIMKGIEVPFGSPWKGKKRDNPSGGTFSTVMKYINTGLFVVASALTGYDRFSMKGALSGLGLSVGLLAGKEALKFDNEENNILKTIWNTGLEGVVLSATTSMMYSSQMKGSFARKVGLRIAEAKGKLSKAEIEALRNLPVIDTPVSAFIHVGGEKVREKFQGKMGEILGNLIEGYAGSPTMLKHVKEFGSLQNIPAKDYLIGNLKDIGYGAAAGMLVSTPIAVGSWMLSSPEESVAEQPVMRNEFMNDVNKFESTKNYVDRQQAYDMSRAMLSHGEWQTQHHKF